ncbi:MAG: tetratricopeptide repeat protein [Pirellulales bacterium]|nr:tetratricopeptide repeat protein [Pirellulales bacterium]
MKDAKSEKSGTADVPRTASKRRQTINGWLLLVSAVILFVVAPGLYFWHYYQTRRLADSFLARADELLAENDPHAAAEYLQRYLLIEPKNAEVRVRLAEVYDSATTGLSKERAIELYHQALGWAAADEIPPLRARLCELLRETGQFNAAEKEAETLLEEVQTAGKNEPAKESLAVLRARGLRLRALAIFRQCEQGIWKASSKENRSVEEIIEEALKANPGDRELVLLMATIYREKPQWLAEDKRSMPEAERHRRADRFIEEMVAAHPADAEALMTRFAYKRIYGKAGAEKDLELALASDANDPRIVFTQAEMEHKAAQDQLYKSGRMEDAIPRFNAAMESYRRVIQLAQEKLDAESSKEKKESRQKPQAGDKVQPTAGEWRGIQEFSFANLGFIQKLRGEPEAAIQTWKTGLKKIPNSEPLNRYLADILLALDRVNEVSRAGNTSAAEGPLDILESLVARLSSQNDPSTGRQEPQYVAKVNALRQSVGLLRGRWHFQRGELQAALPILQLIADGEKRTPEQLLEVYRAAMFVGEIYTRRNQTDRAATAYEAAVLLYEEAAKQDHHMPPAPRLAAAKAWQAMSRFDLAEKHLRRALEEEDTARNRFELAQCLLQREMENPKKARQWADFENAMRDARSAKGGAEASLAWQLDFLELQAAHYRLQDSADLAAARAESLPRFKKLESQYPDDPALLRALISIYEALQAPAETDRALALYAKLRPSDSQAYLLRARIAFARRRFADAVKVLEAEIAQAPPKLRAPLTRELIGMEIVRDRTKEAGERLRALLDAETAEKSEASDAESIKLIFALAMRMLENNQLSDAKRWEEELARREGTEGTLWRYCRGRRLAAAAKSPNDAEFAEAERALAELKKIRPSWSRGFQLEAAIQERRGRLEDAADAYRNAIQAGCRELAVYEKLLALLYRLGRYAEAERRLAEMQDRAAGSAALTAREISLAAGQGQWREAIELARKNAQIQNRDPQAIVSLSRLLVFDDRIAEAEETLLRAIGESPENAALHYQLLWCYQHGGKTQIAKEHLEKIKANAKIPEVERQRLLAEGCELLQDAAGAGAAWQAVIGLTGDAPEEQTALAERLLMADRDPASAEKALRGVLKKAPETARARQLLAKILVARGGEREWNEALSLVSGKHADPQEERQSQALKAVIYANRGGKKNLEQARAIYEKLASGPQQARAEDLVFLAQIYKAEGKLEQAREKLRSVVEMPYPTAPQLAAYLELILQMELPRERESARKMALEAEKWLQKLQALAPDNLQAVALKARFLNKFDRSGEVGPLIESWAERQRPKLPKNPRIEISFLETTGDLYSSVQLHADAERWYRRAMEKSSDHYRLLAQSLARQGRHAEALRLCEDAAAKDPAPQPFLIAALMMLEGRPSAQDYERANAFLAKAAETYRDQPELLNVLAALRIQESRMEEAESLLRRVVELRPRDVQALNNLATVLAEQPGKLSEGKLLLERAMAQVGPQAGLLDLQGVILIAEDKPGEAIPLFEEACAAPQIDPRYCFHGAVAYQRAGDLEKAREALKRARSLDLERQILTPGDKKLLAELEGALSRNNL